MQPPDGRTDGLSVAVALPKLAMGFGGSFSGVYWVCHVLCLEGVFWVLAVCYTGRFLGELS